jgi:hypothetical protein
MIEQEVYDLSTSEGLKKFNDALNSLSDNVGLFNIFGIDGNDFIDNLRKIGNNIHTETSKEKEKPEPKKPETPKFVRPSEKVSTDKKLQIHHIVEEYVNTMIKPFNNGLMTNEAINDAYAGLFEFACWIMNR